MIVATVSGLNVAAVADSVPAAAGEFVPLTATSVIDTTAGVGWPGQLRPGSTDSITVTGVSGVPATGVLAVMLHITTSNSARSGVNANGNLWAWPAGVTRPDYPVVANAPVGSVADNTAIVQVGKAGQISFYNGPSGSAVDIAADVEGYVTSSTSTVNGATFAPLAPSRIIDTQAGTGGRAAPLTSDAPWTFRTLGVGGIPASGVSAVALNVGARATSTNCWVQVQPTGTEADAASYPRIDTYANYTAQGLAVVAPDGDGNVTFSTNCSSTDVNVDVEGYYVAAISGSSDDVYVPIDNPIRVIDTRHNVGITGRLTAGRVVQGAQSVVVRGVGGVPSTADTVALNIGTINATAQGYNTVWTEGVAQPGDGTVDADPSTIESNLVFVRTGAYGRIDVADSSTDPAQSNDLYVDIQGYFLHTAATETQFGTPQYFPAAFGDTFFNTVGTNGEIVATSNDTKGINDACGTEGSDVAILGGSGVSPTALRFSTINCMRSFGTIGGGPGTPDGCSWKSGGITRIGAVIYLAVARQLKTCSDGLQDNGLQPSFNASIIKSSDGGRTWTNSWGVTSRTGAAPAWNRARHRYRAMFPGQAFPAPFFIQYGPGNTRTVDGGNKYLYAVSTDGYAYNGNYLHLARVPLNRVQSGTAWQFYHGHAGGAGRYWTRSAAGATRVLQARHGLSQPAIQYVPALKEYVLVTGYYSQPGSDFPTLAETPYTRFEIYTAPKPWGPWTHVYDHAAQRNLYCTASPCPLVRQPGARTLSVGAPDDWLGFYDPALVQKFVFTRALSGQALFTSGDFVNQDGYPGENLYRLNVMPFDLKAVLRS